MAGLHFGAEASLRPRHSPTLEQADAPQPLPAGPAGPPVDPGRLFEVPLFRASLRSPSDCRPAWVGHTLVSRLLVLSPHPLVFWHQCIDFVTALCQLLYFYVAFWKAPKTTLLHLLASPCACHRWHSLKLLFFHDVTLSLFCLCD